MADSGEGANDRAVTSAFVEIDRRLVRRRLLLLIALFSAASLLAQVAIHLDHHSVGGLVPLLNANGEANLPAYFSALILLACAVLFALIGLPERAHSPAAWRRWAGLALVAAFASVDEAAALHETLGMLIERVFAPGGVLYFVWVIPGALVVVAVALAYRPFVARLPAQLRRSLVAGAAIWAGSALLLELGESAILSSSTAFPASSRRWSAACRRAARCSACS